MARSSILIAVAAMAAVAGCEQSKWPKRTRLTQSQADALNEIAARQQRADDATRGAFQGEAWALGSLPWNATILPLPSPDGRWIATTAGTPPSNAARMALPGALPPAGSRIEIWEILPGFSGMRLQSTIESPFILTDAADKEGFLIESPRRDGSRWIGRVDWRSGELTWLVRDDQVNTMPSLGPRGRLAWSTRARDSVSFSLAFRFADGREFELPADDEDWLFPMWSQRSTRLSVWRLDDAGVLSILSIDGESPATIGEDPRQVLVMVGASRWDAATATANRTAVQGLNGPAVEQVVFYHPTEQRINVWMPTGINDDRLVSLAPGSIDAIHDDRGDFLLTMPKGLHWQSRSDLRNVVRVDHAPVYARSTVDPMRPFILLDPGSEVVRLRAMRPRRETAGAEQAAD